MEPNPLLFRDLAYIFLAAVTGGLIAWRLRLPLIPGFVLGGIAISPFTPGPHLSDLHSFEVFADVGGTGEPIHVGPVTVTNGAATLPNGAAATTITAGLGYVAPFMSAKLAYGAQLGSALTMKKRIDHLGLVLYDTAAQGLFFGQRFDVLDPLPLIEAGQDTPTNTTWSTYDQPMIELPGSWNTDARLCLLAPAPTPVTVGAAVVAISTNEKT